MSCLLLVIKGKLVYEEIEGGKALLRPPVILAAAGDKKAFDGLVLSHVSSLKRGRQLGGRLSKKACIPSWASSPTRTRAMVPTVISSC